MSSPGWLPNIAADSQAGSWLQQELSTHFPQQWRQLTGQRSPQFSAVDILGGWLVRLENFHGLLQHIQFCVVSDSGHSADIFSFVFFTGTIVFARS
jgi:hypothetical protein